MRISLIVAIERQTRAIGKDNQLLWNLPEDMKRFKEIRQGKPVIMGRRTYESIPAKYRPLKGSLNIVVTRKKDYDAPGAVIVHSPQEALLLAKKHCRNNKIDEVIVAGGAEIYEAIIHQADRLYLTLVDDPENAAGADTFFPEYEEEFQNKVEGYDVVEGRYHTYYTIRRRR